MVGEPRQPIREVLQAHDLHALSRLTLFLRHNVRDQPIDRQDIDEKHEEWEVSFQEVLVIICCGRRSLKGDDCDCHMRSLISHLDPEDGIR